MFHGKKKTKSEMTEKIMTIFIFEGTIILNWSNFNCSTVPFVINISSNYVPFSGHSATHVQFCHSWTPTWKIKEEREREKKCCLNIGNPLIECRFILSLWSDWIKGWYRGDSCSNVGQKGFLLVAKIDFYTLLGKSCYIHCLGL